VNQRNGISSELSAALEPAATAGRQHRTAAVTRTAGHEALRCPWAWSGSLHPPAHFRVTVLDRSPALLRPGGTLVSVRAAAPPPASRDDITTVIFIQESSRAQLIELARLVDEGHLRPQVGGVYPLVEAATAYSAKAGGGIPGRIVLQP